MRPPDRFDRFSPRRSNLRGGRPSFVPRPQEDPVQRPDAVLSVPPDSVSFSIGRRLYRKQYSTLVPGREIPATL